MYVYIVCFEQNSYNTVDPIEGAIANVFFSKNKAEQYAMQLNGDRTPNFDDPEDSGWVVVRREVTQQTMNDTMRLIEHG